MPKVAKSEIRGILLVTKLPASNAERTAQQTSCDFPAGCISPGKTTTTFASRQMPAPRRVFFILAQPQRRRVSQRGKDIPSRNGNLELEEGAVPHRREQVI